MGESGGAGKRDYLEINVGCAMLLSRLRQASATLFDTSFDVLLDLSFDPADGATEANGGWKLRIKIRAVAAEAGIYGRTTKARTLTDLANAKNTQHLDGLDYKLWRTRVSCVRWMDHECSSWRVATLTTQPWLKADVVGNDKFNR